MRNRTKFTLSTIALALCSSMALAQEDATGFFAKADTTLAHDDNIYRVTDDLAQSDTYLSVAPELKLIGGFGKQRFELSYNGDYSKFADTSDADYSDHDIRAKINFDHSLRFTSKFEAGYQKEHEDPGSINRIQLDITEYNKFNQNYFLAGFAYGGESAAGRIALEYRKNQKDHINNNLNFLDFVSDEFIGRFTFRLAPKTRAYLETIYADNDYENVNGFELDNIYKRYRVGLTWDFTNKLSGDINIGYQDRDYDLETLRDIDGLAYNGQVNWSINTYTTLEMVARRESIDSSLEQTGGFLRTSYGLNLSHELSELMKIEASAGYASDELVFTTARKDDRFISKIALEYSVLRNIAVGLSYSYEQRDSTDLLAEFEANIFGINVIFSMDE
ncbi:outer membrane beta-barrel protein [Aestuariibacter sp. GS-14]|uniref:outer membrane beta-barrel protein n=1 Tax=Aestuariibacter sp. GS-14 TaxID=2590670 RepID=UPI0015E85A22|nr:outer membrane beta-barrel protein [Aestuariibacter sp. GS-14]